MDDFDENNDCVTKSKLIVKVKTLSKYNSSRGGIQMNKQTNNQTYSETWKLRNI